MPPHARGGSTSDYISLHGCGDDDTTIEGFDMVIVLELERYNNKKKGSGICLFCLQASYYVLCLLLYYCLLLL
jgi:hypothetical protein